MDVHDTKVTQREKYTKQRENERPRAGGRWNYGGGVDEQAWDRRICFKRHPNIDRTHGCVQEKVHCSTPDICLLQIEVEFSAEMITEGRRVSAEESSSCYSNGRDQSQVQGLREDGAFRRGKTHNQQISFCNINKKKKKLSGSLRGLSLISTVRETGWMKTVQLLLVAPFKLRHS